MADDDFVQPDAGQGDESQPDSPYQEYLDRIPEEARGAAEEAFRAWDANTTKKFQEASEYRQQWEPLSNTGIQGRDPEEVQWAMQFVDALQDPRAIANWYKGYAEENGLDQSQQQQQQGLEEQEWVDPTTQSYLERWGAENLGPLTQQLNEFNEWRQAQETQAREREAMASIESNLKQLEHEHPDDFDRDKIEMFLPRHIESDPENAVNLAFQDYMSLRNQIQKSTLQSKLDQPPGAESGGVADTGVPEINSLQKAAEVARQQLMANRNM